MATITEIYNKIDTQRERLNELNQAEDLTLTAAVSRTINNYSINHDLPSAYTEMEYLESSGTQYINLPYYIKSNSKVSCVGYWNSTSPTDYPHMFGSYNPSCYLYGNKVPGSAIYYACGEAQVKQQQICARVPIKWELDLQTFSGTAYLHPLSYSVGSTRVSGTSTLDLFACNDALNHWHRYFSCCRIYEFVLSEGGREICHLIPAMRDSDFELGFYDMVNNHFYTNDGTGVFSAGELE